MFRLSFLASASLAESRKHLVGVVVRLTNAQLLVATRDSGKIRAEILLHLNVRLLYSYTVVEHVYVVLLLATRIPAARDQIGVFLVPISGVDSSFLLLQVVLGHSGGTLPWVVFADILFVVLVLDEPIDVILFRSTAIALPHICSSSFLCLA